MIQRQRILEAAGLVAWAALLAGCGGAGAPEGNLPEPKPISVEESRKIQKEAQADLSRMLSPGSRKDPASNNIPKAK